MYVPCACAERCFHAPAVLILALTVGPWFVTVLAITTPTGQDQVSRCGPFLQSVRLRHGNASDGYKGTADSNERSGIKLDGAPVPPDGRGLGHLCPVAKFVRNSRRRPCTSKAHFTAGHCECCHWVTTSAVLGIDSTDGQHWDGVSSAPIRRPSSGAHLLWPWCGHCWSAQARRTGCPLRSSWRRSVHRGGLPTPTAETGRCLQYRDARGSFTSGTDTPADATANLAGRRGNNLLRGGDCGLHGAPGHLGPGHQNQWLHSDRRTTSGLWVSLPVHTNLQRSSSVSGPTDSRL